MPHLRVNPPASGASMAERVRALRYRLRLGRPQLAVRLGVSRQYITKLEAGAMPSRPVLLLMEHLERGAGFALAGSQAPGVKSGPATPLPLRLLPVTNLAQIGSLPSLMAPKPTVPKQLAFATDDVHAFALRLDAASECPPDLENSIAVISPAAKIRNGDFVIVRLKGASGAPALLRVFHEQGSDRGATLSALRADVPPLHVTREQVRWISPVVATLRFPGS